MSSSADKNRSGRRLLLYAVFIAVLVSFDQLMKHLAVVKLKGQDPFVLIPGVLEFRYLENQGAAFSMFQNRQIMFYIITAVFLVLAVWFLVKLPKSRKYRPLIVCLLVLSSGAVGNLIDRIVHQYVVDFIYFSIIDFPIFNVADIYVTLSVTVLIILVLFKYKDEDFSVLRKKKPAPDKETGTEDE